MRKWLSILTASSLFFSCFVNAESIETLPFAQRLRRLSMITRGIDPSPEDRAHLRILRRSFNDGTINSWFADRAQAFTQSEEFEEKMISNLSRLFLIREPFVSDSSPNVNTMHMLFHKILNENRSWDELLTSQTIAVAQANTTSANFGFYQSVLSKDEFSDLQNYMDKKQLQALVKDVHQGGTDDSDIAGVNQPIDWAKAGYYKTVTSPEVAGVLSDPQFYQRYWTTPINQNRKRAAQIFRVFLCDEMHAVILPDSKVLADLQAAGLDSPAEAKSAGFSVQDVQTAARHASDERCSTCHSKLDPLGNVFRGSSFGLSATPVAGYLSYVRRSGEHVHIRFKNGQELARAIVAQPEYLSCQVHHFWDWFIGSDIAMSYQTETQLMQKFDELGRRPRDFANYLVDREEFYKFPHLTVESVQFRHISGILRACQSCHDNEFEAPDLTKLPFTNIYSASHQTIVEKMIEKLDLLGDGSHATMPPKGASWHVDGGNRSLLMAWLADGAPDDSGRPTWSNPPTQAQLLQRVQDEHVSFDLRPTFDLTAHRRMTALEFEKEVEKLSEELYNDANVFKLRTSPYDQGDLATLDLNTGKTISNPNHTYIKEIQSYTDEFVRPMQAILGALLPKLNLGFISPETVTASMSVPIAPELCEKVGRSLYWRLFGSMPTPAESENLKRYSDQMSQKYDTSTCITETLTQLLWSTRNLTY